MRFLLVLVPVALLLATTVAGVAAAGWTFSSANGEASGNVDVTWDGSGCVEGSGSLTVEDGGINYDETYGNCD